MSELLLDNIKDRNGGNTSKINGMTPTAQSLQGFRNRIINGDMRIDQRNAGASVTPTDGVYTLDRWLSQTNVGNKFSVQRNAGAVTPPTGFTNYLGVTSTSAYTVGAAEFSTVQQNIEGFNVADLGWGTASAQAVTVTFWVRSSLTGTFGGTVANSAQNRTYPFTYAISSANTWEQKTLTIPGDTTGTWLTDNGLGIRLRFGLGCGATRSATAGAWTADLVLSATGAVSVLATSGATFYITGVQLEAGSVATPFERRPYGTELALCQRYYTRLNTGGGIYTGFALGYQVSTTGAYFIMSFPVSMRASPTLAQSNCAVNDTNTFTAPITSLDNLFVGPNTARFRAVWSTGYGAAYRPVDLIANANAAAYFELTAEL